MTHKRSSGNLPSQSLRPIRLTTGDLPQESLPAEALEEESPVSAFSIPAKPKLPSRAKPQQVEAIDMLNTVPHVAQKVDDISDMPTTQHPLTPMPLMPETPPPPMPFVPETPLPQNNQQYAVHTPTQYTPPPLNQQSSGGMQPTLQRAEEASVASSSLATTRPAQAKTARMLLVSLLILGIIAAALPMPFIYNILVTVSFPPKDATLFAWTLTLLFGLLLFAGVLLSIIRTLISSLRRPATA